MARRLNCLIHRSRSRSPRSTRRLWSDPPPVQRYHIVWANDQQISCMRLALASSNMRTETKLEGTNLETPIFWFECTFVWSASSDTQRRIHGAAGCLHSYHRLNVRVHRSPFTNEMTCLRFGYTVDRRFSAAQRKTVCTTLLTNI